MQPEAGPALHVGIIMDGNGRWAQARGLTRIAGHARGARRVSEIVETCPALGVTHLTLYAFSTENWRRPLSEVEALMRIFRTYIRRKMDGLRVNGVRVRFIGMRDRVPAALRSLMDELETATRGCGGLNLTIAIDYGGRNELARAVRSIAGSVAKGGVDPAAICEATLDGALDTGGLPDPDFIIRTSGEMRLSNFLLWQGVYAEYAFPRVTWPEFGTNELAEAVAGFRQRQRRFGTAGAATAAVS